MEVIATMAEVAKIFSITMPIFLVLILGEKFYGRWKGTDTVPWVDALSSAYSGIIFSIWLVLGLTITVVSYEFLVGHLALFHWESTFLLYILTFVVIDFNGYWGHRITHEFNVFWNKHLIHHSSEEFNLACALRQSAFDVVEVFFFLLIPAAIIGIPATTIAAVLPIHKLAQYWYHTRLINKLGFLEHIIVTPSHHRVHHALNPIYLDKNFSAIFIIWDKLFGTFQKELESEPPVYGITRPSQTWNPITINFEHLALLVKDAWRAESWMDKLTIWFRPTGWRPKGFEEKYPVNKITDPFNFEKYNPPLSTGLVLWSNIQFFVLFGLVIFMMHNFTMFGGTGLYIFAVFVFAQVYSATELMNRNKWAPLYSFIATIVTFAIYFYDTSWFGTGKISSILPVAFLIYFLLQTIAAFIFTMKVTTYHFLQNDWDDDFRVIDDSVL